MRIAILSPVALSTPPAKHSPREKIVSLLTEGLVGLGVDVTLFATKDSVTKAKLKAVIPRGYEDDIDADHNICHALHISSLIDHADEFDLIHNHSDFLPIIFSDMTDTAIVTTIHESMTLQNLPAYKKYNDRVFYVSPSDESRSADLTYSATIPFCVDTDAIKFSPKRGDFLLYLDDISPENGTKEAIDIAMGSGTKLVIAGDILVDEYFDNEVMPYLDGYNVEYAGSVDQKQRDELFCDACALLRPILHDEPFGFSAIESMAYGTPVIAFNRGSMSEIIADGVTGFLASSVKEAAEAVSHIDTIDRKACRTHIELNFSASGMVNAYLELYSIILDDNKREDHRPWGYYKILEDKPDHKVKRIVVYPGKRLSLQKHNRRAEHWYILHGKATVTLGSKELILKAGDSVEIPVGMAHRIMNTGKENMTFIEVQSGDYFGEDDIERLEDDYGRE